MRCQFATQQFGIATCNKNPKARPQQSVDKDMPAIYILDFIEKHILDINAIYLVEAHQQEIQFIRLHTYKPVIIEVGVCICNAVFLQYFMAKC